MTENATAPDFSEVIGKLAPRSEPVRLHVRGRTIELPGVRQPPSGILKWLFIFGPGLVAAMAGDDAGGVATYSQAGASFGYELLWVLAIITVSLAVVQEMSSRLGAATGRGFLDLVRERYGLRWAMVLVTVVLLANGGIVVTEFAGIAAAAELLGVTRLIAVPLAAAFVWFLVVRGSYRKVEKLFLLMSLVFITYPIAAFLANPSWSEVGRGLIPTIHPESAFLTLFVGLIGTTITPYMQLFQQSTIVEKGVQRKRYGPERADSIVGAVVSNTVAAFIIIATAATLHANGATEIESAADAAKALAPVAGQAAGTIFGVGLLGASLLAAGVLPIATAYSIGEAFGFRKGVDLDFRQAPAFTGIFSALVVAGAAIALVPNIPLIALLVGIQVLNGALLPIILVFLLLLANNGRLTRELKNGRISNVLGWGTIVLVTVAVVAMFVLQGMELLAGSGG